MLVKTMLLSFDICYKLNETKIINEHVKDEIISQQDILVKRQIESGMYK